MFRLLLKILGLEKYEYPEYKTPIGALKNKKQAAPVQNQSNIESNQKVDSTPIAETKSEVETKPVAEIKPEVETKPVAEIKPKVETKPVAEIKPKVETKPVAEAKPEADKQTTPKKHKPEIVSAESIAASFSGLKPHYAKMLIEAGFDSVQKITNASDKELLSIKGIGKASLKILRQTN